MSKLGIGMVKVLDLEAVRGAAKLLGWQVTDERYVTYFYGQGPACDLVIRPVGELDRYEQEVGMKYSIGFVETEQGVVSYHDNAMNGVEVMEEGKLDDTTARVIGKLKQAIARVEIERTLKKQKASWRVEQRADGAQIMVIRR